MAQDDAVDDDEDDLDGNHYDAVDYDRDGLGADDGAVYGDKEGLDLMGVMMTTMTFDSTSVGLCSKTEWKSRRLKTNSHHQNMLFHAGMERTIFQTTLLARNINSILDGCNTVNGWNDGWMDGF